MHTWSFQSRQTLFFFFLFFFPFNFISWRLINLQYCSGFCHTLTWISRGFTCIPHPDPPSHLPLHLIPLGLTTITVPTPHASVLPPSGVMQGEPHRGGTLKICIWECIYAYCSLCSRKRERILISLRYMFSFGGNREKVPEFLHFGI